MANDWKVAASDCARRTHNQIRNVIDEMKIVPHEDKPMINLSIGDPTVFGNLHEPEIAVKAVCDNVKSSKYNGYAHGAGAPHVRAAIAEHYTCKEAPLTADDVVITSGCSGALEMAITVLCNPDNNIILPHPGFPLYATIAANRGTQVRYYDLKPEKGWEADIEQMKSLIDEKTSAILVNNPSNPNGSVFSREHLLEILHVAESHKLPIIADEIYADMVFPGHQFYALSALTTTVPILTCGGIAKRYLVPGWRQGWILVHDRNGVFKQEVCRGLVNLTGVLVGSSTLAQSVIPAVLKETPEAHFDDLMKVLASNAKMCFDVASKVEGIYPVAPQGAMYMMFRVDVGHFKDIPNDMAFCEKLCAEESVFCLPGKCFGYENYCRIVFSGPEDKLREAFSRMGEFCKRHAA
eukprot:Nk52_evm1s2374 gene=Nk52_evmTU1s2374